MKALFFTLVILAGLFAGYDYFLAPPWQRVIFEKGPRPAEKPTLAQNGSHVQDDGPAIASKPKDTSAKKDDWQPSFPALPNLDFIPPVIPTVEAVTAQWMQIPKQAFPRQVVIKKDVQIQMAVGSSTLRSGATVHALAADKGMLTIAPTETSAARGSIAILDTDFPAQIQQAYDKWKVARIEQARHAWQQARTKVTAAGKDNSTLPNGEGIQFAEGGKPVQNKDGSYNLLLAVISTGRVTDVDPQKVIRWSAPRQDVLDGKPVWVIDVTYPTQTIFGPMDVESHAYVRDQQLLRWVFDSGEPVP